MPPNMPPMNMAVASGQPGDKLVLEEAAGDGSRSPCDDIVW